MDKIQLSILGITYSQTQTGAYALILGESDGKRRLPIIIGGFEAQAIAIELEKMKPNRPLTHDLFKSLSKTYQFVIKEVIINKFSEGVFFARLICEKNGKIDEIDARTSDAVAIAVRFQCPIYTNETVMKAAGVIIEEGKENEMMEGGLSPEEKQEETDYTVLTIEELNEMLMTAIDEEAFEKASKLRDEINKRKKKK
jgi:bifunctional DNase/RNase